MSTTVPPLTEKQAEVLGFIEQFMRDNSYFPPYTKIAEGVGLSSKSNISRYMVVLERKGYIQRGENPRATQLLRGIR
jgi:SOS-response transcriptional repressor LexA